VLVQLQWIDLLEKKTRELESSDRKSTFCAVSYNDGMTNFLLNSKSGMSTVKSGLQK
jgi:hypothetical protein